MDFSNEQRLIVTLLTEIHAKLGIEDGLDPNFVQEMVSSGHTWALNWKYPGLFSGPVETPHNVKRVADVLDMWDVIERTVSSLSPAEKSEVERLTSPAHVSSARFSGYSGNTEDEYSIVHVLVERLGKWSSFSGRDFDAHMPMVDVYDRMLDAYQIVNPISAYSPTLSVESLVEVLNARTHPDNR
ncbi:YfbU family protein [Pseudomonas syringae]|uniref:YfbU family protein n=1 Tax=Pseudomonas syringae TaxID=317 RepID=UPI00070B5EED|nr:YfbU family protein [Pseudomonas syringae]ALU60275.1 hypothetical protein ACA40_10530 [Pseudomonas syringae pv. lapsa]QVI77399.1 YfbU family protein [Pseudomonas syringae]